MPFGSSAGNLQGETQRVSVEFRISLSAIKGLQKRYSHRKTLILSGFFCFYGQNFYFRFVRTKKIFF